MDYVHLPTNPSSSLGDPALGTLGVSVSLRDVPRPTGPEEEAVFVLVSILDHSDTRVIIGSTEMKHIAGPHLDFGCTVGFHRVLPLDTTSDPRKLLFEVFVAGREVVPEAGEPLVPCKLREGSPGVKRVALHITPLFTSLYHGVVSYGLLDSDHPHQGLYSPLRAPLAEHTVEGQGAAAMDAPLPAESKPLGYIQTTALPLTPLAYTLGMVQLKCAFKGFPVRPSGRPSTPYLQVQRKVGQRGDVYVTEPAWCGIPKRSGGRRDPANPPPPGTPTFMSDPVTLEIPIVALLEAGSGGMGVRSLRDVRSSITAMVRLEVCDWYGDEGGGEGGEGGGKDPSFGTLDVRLSELLDPALTSPFLDAVLHREGGEGPDLVVRFFDTVLVPLYNPFPSLLPLPPAPAPTPAFGGKQQQQQQQQQGGEGGYLGGMVGVGGEQLASPLPPPTISSAPSSLPSPLKPALLLPPPLPSSRMW